MTATRCVHGIDSRFCSVCNRSSKASRPESAIGSATLPEILAFLNAEQMRATYRAVGDVLGVSPLAISRTLGAHIPEASWIVSAETLLPAGYTAEEMHPSLLRTDEIIRSGPELIMRMTQRNAKQKG
jgi:hypothetical protein